MDDERRDNFEGYTRAKLENIDHKLKNLAESISNNYKDQENRLRNLETFKERTKGLFTITALVSVVGGVVLIVLQNW